MLSSALPYHFTGPSSKVSRSSLELGALSPLLREEGEYAAELHGAAK